MYVGTLVYFTHRWRHQRQTGRLSKSFSNLWRCYLFVLLLLTVIFRIAILKNQSDSHLPYSRCGGKLLCKNMYLLNPNIFNAVFTSGFSPGDFTRPEIEIIERNIDSMFMRVKPDWHVLFISSTLSHYLCICDVFSTFDTLHTFFVRQTPVKFFPFP
jgi:hypothetical protein